MPDDNIDRPIASEGDAPRLLQKIRDEIGPEMIKEFGYGSVMQVPRLDKVIVNIGLGEALQNARAIES